MNSLLQIIKQQARERWKDISEQRLKKYRIALSPIHKLALISGYSCAVILGVLGLNLAYGQVSKIRIDYTDCAGGSCSYSFTLSRAAPARGHVYVKVNNLPQTHLAYRDTRPAEPPGRCDPYFENGRWVYPCGIVDSTYPKDKYQIVSADNQTVFSLDPETMAATSEQSIQSWRRPSSFSSAIHKLGEIEALPAGSYTFTVDKAESYPEKSREALIMFNLSPFGAVLHNIGGLVISAAFVLSIINSLACINYV